MNEMRKLVDIRYSEQFRHQMIPEKPRRNLDSFTSFSELINRLDHQNKKHLRRLIEGGNEKNRAKLRF